MNLWVTLALWLDILLTTILVAQPASSNPDQDSLPTKLNDSQLSNYSSALDAFLAHHPSVRTSVLALQLCHSIEGQFCGCLTHTGRGGGDVEYTEPVEFFECFDQITHRCKSAGKCSPCVKNRQYNCASSKGCHKTCACRCGHHHLDRYSYITNHFSCFQFCNSQSDCASGDDEDPSNCPWFRKNIPYYMIVPVAVLLLGIFFCAQKRHYLTRYCYRDPPNGHPHVGQTLGQYEEVHLNDTTPHHTPSLLDKHVHVHPTT